MNRTILYRFANLIKRLSFKLLKIIALKKYTYAKDIQNLLENFKSLLATNDIKIKNKQKCKLLSVKKYLEDSKSLFINYLYNINKKQNKNITFFLYTSLCILNFLRSYYLCF